MTRTLHTTVWSQPALSTVIAHLCKSVTSDRDIAVFLGVPREQVASIRRGG